jgi:A/G-specific adenine glycosylase
MQNVSYLINWYKKNFRDLPWRSTNDPYKIWLSEIILQQTQVVQGLNYYHRFITEYPTVSKLAEADEEEVLRHWQGLGYYSRARNLHKTAKIINSVNNGIFPNKKADLLKLPGIGDYTASAILSFAFNQAYPCLDGNVFRVLSRYYDIDLPIDEPASRKVFIDILESMIVHADPKLFNNAMMELGATICKNDKPSCPNCPLYLDCQSRIKDIIPQRPVKKKKLKKRQRFFNYLFIRYKDDIYIQRRSEKDIWHGLYEFPLLESDKQLQKDELQSSLNMIITNFSDVKYLNSVEVKHLLTHQIIDCTFWMFEAKSKPQFISKNCLTISLKSYTEFPFPILISKFLLSL